MNYFEDYDSTQSFQSALQNREPYKPVLTAIQPAVEVEAVGVGEGGDAIRVGFQMSTSTSLFVGARFFLIWDLSLTMGRKHFRNSPL